MKASSSCTTVGRTQVGSKVGEASRWTLPDLADRVADDIYSQRLTLSPRSQGATHWQRAELGRWRGEVRKMLARVLS